MRELLNRATSYCCRLSWTWVFHQLESVAIAFSTFVGLTLVVFGFRLDSWVHEWGNFLRHYASASASARYPVNLFLLAAYLGLLAVVWLSRRPKGTCHV